MPNRPRPLLAAVLGALLLWGLLLGGCTSNGPAETSAEPAAASAPDVASAPAAPIAEPEPGPAGPEAAEPEPVVVAELWETERRPEENLDSVAVWPGAGDRAWLLATAKDTHRLLVFDAASGELLRELGGAGDGPGQFQRPNGIAVVDDLAFVVERDNARVQVLRLPGLASLGVFGTGELERPYGITAFRHPEGGYEVWVTDDYAAGGPWSGAGSLDRRLRRYRVGLRDGHLEAAGGEAFGAAAGEGALATVESLAADPQRGRLLVADENAATRRVVLYGLDGAWTGPAATGFGGDPEGIALYACPDGGGYWLVADQRRDLTRFRLLDRDTLAPVAVFVGRLTANTDGVWLSQVPLPDLPAGALYAIHDDRSVTAFDWRHVAAATGVRGDCLLEGK